RILLPVGRYHGVPGVIAAGIADDVVHPSTEKVGDLTLTFVAPLRTGHNYRWHRGLPGGERRSPGCQANKNHVRVEPMRAAVWWMSFPRGDFRRAPCHHPDAERPDGAPRRLRRLRLRHRNA